MFRRLHQALFCILLLAVSLQGLAGTAVRGCGNASPMEFVHSGMNGSRSDRHHDSDEAMGMDGVEVADGLGHKAPSKTAMQDCGTSATACSLLTAAPMSGNPAPVPQAIAVAGPPSSRVTPELAFFTGAPERPPRRPA